MFTTEEPRRRQLATYPDLSRLLRNLSRFRFTTLSLTVLLGVQLGILAYASSLPPQAGWGMYAVLPIPASVTQAFTRAEVSDRLIAADYNVTAMDWPDGRRVLNVTRDDDPNFRARIEGLGGPAAGRLTAEVRWVERYLAGRFREMIPVLRAKLATLVEDADLPLDPTQAEIGDNDFEPPFWDHSWMFLGQVCLLVVLMPAVAVAFATDLRRNRSGL